MCSLHLTGFSPWETLICSIYVLELNQNQILICIFFFEYVFGLHAYTHTHIYIYIYIYYIYTYTHTYTQKCVCLFCSIEPGLWFSGFDGETWHEGGHWPHGLRLQCRRIGHFPSCRSVVRQVGPLSWGILVTSWLFLIKSDQKSTEIWTNGFIPKMCPDSLIRNENFNI